MSIFDRLESEVRSYCRTFPVVFDKGCGTHLYDENGNEYIDFFSGAGVLNYGHNNSYIKKAVLDYIERDGVVHSLDMWTVAKRQFLESIEEIILKPRNLDYKIQFTGPTGTNAVEAALKLTRKVKRRANIIAFTNGYHGMSMGSLSITGNRYFRNENFINRLNVSFMPFDGYFGDKIDTLEYLERFLSDNSSGVDIPAAIIVETVQAEGGVNIARFEWLKGLDAVCKEFDILLIVDDIQVGNGRTGTFFSFELAKIQPDIVILSKSISGLGLPMSLVLINSDIDCWKPAEHTGTFRGNNLAFVAGKAALDFWRTDQLSKDIICKGEILDYLLKKIQKKFSLLSIKVRGRGLIYGLDMSSPELAKAISAEAFRRGLIIELAGSNDQVLKFLPPLIIDDELLIRGIKIIEDSIASVDYEKLSTDR